MLGIPCRYDKRQHRIIHPQLEGWVKRQVPGKFGASLFIYYHNLQGTFVIATWRVPGKLFEDIVNLGDSLANFDRAMAENFRANVKSPVGSRQLANALRQKERDRLSNKQGRCDDHKAQMDWALRKKVSVSLAKTK